MSLKRCWYTFYMKRKYCGTCFALSMKDKTQRFMFQREVHYVKERKKRLLNKCKEFICKLGYGNK